MFPISKALSKIRNKRRVSSSTVPPDSASQAEGSIVPESASPKSVRSTASVSSFSGIPPIPFSAAPQFVPQDFQHPQQRESSPVSGSVDPITPIQDKTAPIVLDTANEKLLPTPQPLLKDNNNNNNNKEEAVMEITAAIQKSVPLEVGKDIVVTKDKHNVHASVSEFPHDKVDEKYALVHTETAVSATSTSTSFGIITHTLTDGSIQPESRVAEVVQYVKGLFSKLGDYEVGMLHRADLESYLEYIADERLIHMPRKGSDWDRVLRTAQFFGLQIWRFGEKVAKFAPESRQAAVAALASCQMLLEIGHSQAGALLPAFMTLYELGLLVSQITQIPGIFDSSKNVKADISRLYSELVSLAGGISVHYRNHIFNLDRRHQAITLNLNDLFGFEIDAIWASKTALYDRIWKQSLGNKQLVLSIGELRHRLNPQSEAFRLALYAELAEDLERAEDTCEWVKSDLVDFLESNEKILTVTGAPGSGKTVLADWIEERLQRPLNKTTYSVLLYTFPFDAHEDATVLSFLKGLLFQLLERSVGNVALYESLVSAYAGEKNHAHDHHGSHHKCADFELALWKALKIGLSTYKKSEEPIVLLIDGFEEVSGGAPSAVAAFFKSLQENVFTVNNVRTITFSRYEHKLGNGIRNVAIAEHDVAHDITSFLRQNLSSRSPLFMELTPSHQERIIEALTTKAKGSFLWARLAGNYLIKYHGYPTTPNHHGYHSHDHKVEHNTVKSFVQAAESISSDVGDILLAMESKLDLKGDHHLRDMLSFLLVSDRPLDTDDLAELLAVDIAGHAVHKPVDIGRLVARTVPDLVLVRDGRVRFKSSIIRAHLYSRLGKSLPAVKEAHHQLVLRLLLYTKLSVHSSIFNDPTMDDLDETTARRLFEKHRLLRFVMTYWVYHFRASTQYSSNNLSLSKDFKSVFPDSVIFALLERYSWSTTADFVARLTLTLRIREAVFTEKHSSVLQNLVVLGHVHLANSQAIDSSRYFYRAAVLGQAVLSRFSALVIACTDMFLQITETIVFTTRTEIVTYREALLRFKIEVCIERFGHHSEVVIEWYKKLAALYDSIQEKEHYVLVYREIYEIILARNDTPEVIKLKKFFGGLDVTLKDGEEKKHVQGYGKLLLETAEDINVTDDVLLYISIMLRVASSYETDGHWHWAERIYISLWRKVSILSRSTLTVDIHTAKIKVALAYITYLRSVNRFDEASNILMVIWTEYEHYNFETEELVLYLREIGILFRSFGILDVAGDIFGKVWGWYKGRGKATDVEAGRTMVYITEVVKEVTTTTKTTKTKTTISSETTEVIVHDIYATHYERCAKSGVDETFFAATFALIEWLVAAGNWGEVETTVRKSLEISWKAILTADVNVKLTEHFSKEVVRLAQELAVCHKNQHQFDKAEQVYLRIYYAALDSLSFEHELFIEALAGLISFYEEYHRHEKIIDIYVELVKTYRSKVGAAHHLTIRALYVLAAQYEILGRKEAYACYTEIVTVLNKGLKYCHRDAFKASVALVSFYYIEKRWTELQVVCSILWETFLHHEQAGDSSPYDVSDFSEATVSLIYEKYVYTLEYHAKVDVKVLYEISVKYREIVTKRYGASSAIVLAALVALARICERTQNHQHEAVTIYEEVISRHKTNKTTVTVETETTIKTVTQRLSTLYVTIVRTGGGAKGSGGANGVKEIGFSIDRAIHVSLESFALYKVEYGIWHAKTLAVLQDIVFLYQQAGTKEAHGKVVALLQTTIVDVLTTLTVSVQLFQAATIIANIYATAGLTEVAHSLLHQLRYLLVFGQALPAGVSVKLDLKLSGSVNSRVVFLFVAAFERQICAQENKAVAITFSELLSSMLYEILLYEDYRAVIDNNDIRTEEILLSGSRLRGFWSEEKRAELVTFLDSRLFAVFKARYAEYVKTTSDEHTKLFYLALLSELNRDKADSSYAVLACRAGNAEVRALLEAGEFSHALGVARLAFTFAAKQGFYKSTLARIAYGYKLAELLAGVDVRAPAPDSAIRADLLALSREVTAEVFSVLAAEKIDLAKLEVNDVAGLVRLLGAQADYVRLEMLLLHLWQSREVRRSWRPATVLSIGFALVHAYAGQKQKLDRAIDLADLLWYNLRRSRGWLDKDAVTASQLLASLYVEAGRAADAMSVYESVLRQVEAASVKSALANGANGANGSNGANGANGAGHTEDAQGDRALLALHARQYLSLLSAAHARLGRWTKPKKEFHDLYNHLRDGLGLKAQLPASFDKWAASATSAATDKSKLPGQYVTLADWRIAGESENVRTTTVAQ